MCREERITAEKLSQLIREDSSQVLIDVRSNSEFEICHIPGSRNVPMSMISKSEGQNIISEIIKEQKTETDKLPGNY